MIFCFAMSFLLDFTFQEEQIPDEDFEPMNNSRYRREVIIGLR